MPGHVFMGHRSYGSPVVRGDISDIRIGKYCSIAQNVIVDLGWHHNTKFITTYPLNVMFEKLKHITGHPKSKGDIIIENDVWIGEGSIIMGGVHIGSGSVIGAGSIVTKNVEPYSIVAGNPAKQIRKRFSEDQINSLLKINWWDWPEEKIIENADLLMNEQTIQQFINKHSQND